MPEQKLNVFDKKQSEELFKVLIDLKIADTNNLYSGEGKIRCFMILDLLYDNGFCICTKKE